MKLFYATEFAKIIFAKDYYRLQAVGQDCTTNDINIWLNYCELLLKLHCYAIVLSGTTVFVAL